MPTGTHLLGLVKHLATVEWGHFGAAFDRPYAERLPWVDEETEPNADLWATAEESREELSEPVAAGRLERAHTIGCLAPDGRSWRRIRSYDRGRPRSGGICR